LEAHTPTDPWRFTATAFQQRRRDTWKAIRIWIVLEALAIGGFLIAGLSKSAPAQRAGELFGAFHYSRSLADMTLWQLNLAFGSFAAMLGAGIAITMGIQRHYRCPKCETVPMGSWTTFGPGGIGKNWGVEFNPSICRKCGARLR
jgi:hypothetical protein